MRKVEFVRLVQRGTLTLVWHNAETGVVTATAGRTGVTVTMRPDLPGLPVKESDRGLRP